MTDKLTIKQMWDINKLNNWPDNPREIKTEKFNDLKESLKQEGQLMPLLVDMRSEHEGEVIGGNMTLRALKELGYKEVWVELKTPRDDAHAFEIAIKHNMRYGQYAQDLLLELSEKYKDVLDLSKLDVDLKEPPNLQDLLDQFKPIEEDEVPEVPTEAISKLGEVYQLGRHRLMCGDATKIEDVEKLMNGAKADMVFTDPPYSVNYEKKNKEILKSNSYSKITNDDMEVKDIAKEIWKPTFDNLALISKDGASIYVTMPQGGDQMMMMMMMDSWQVKHELIWVKRSPVFSMGRLDYDYMHEPIMYGWKKNHQFYGGGQYTKSVWTIDRDSDKSHPTMKPVALMVNAIKNSTKEEDIVIDCFGGSGSTLIACEQTNRICCMMELDPKYCDVIRKRYAKFIGKENEWQTL